MEFSWKERLRHYKHMKQELGRQRERLERLCSSLELPAHGEYNALRPSGKREMEAKSNKGYHEDRLADGMDRLFKLENKILDSINWLNNETLEIETAIQGLSDPMQREIMRLRYIEGEKWENICVLISYEWAQTHRMHGIALQKLR